MLPTSPPLELDCAGHAPPGWPPASAGTSQASGTQAGIAAAAAAAASRCFVPLALPGAVRWLALLPQSQRLVSAPSLRAC